MTKNTSVNLLDGFDCLAWNAEASESIETYGITQAQHKTIRDATGLISSEIYDAMGQLVVPYSYWYTKLTGEPLYTDEERKEAYDEFFGSNKCD